ncbi:hypothetical protein T4E_1653 [Trichinella pseudospiralis]|uniref:Uncharacterized protein n=1 Tax=Trichinella pseudospiralis TaxID=6337 RepID=A0A0V0XY57_TRIPS|nr:hypothetical protein T4E_1653 [Trichinella pseudospiralis]
MIVQKWRHDSLFCKHTGHACNKCTNFAAEAGSGAKRKLNQRCRSEKLFSLFPLSLTFTGWLAGRMDG